MMSLLKILAAAFLFAVVVTEGCSKDEEPTDVGVDSTLIVTWTQLKNPAGGAIQSIAINGSLIFVGTESGGVFRSIDEGLTWKQGNANLTSTSVNSVAVNSQDLVFVATGEGVFGSSDNGASWTQANKGLTSTDVVCISFTSDGYLFAGTRDGDVFKSAKTTLR